MNIEHNILIDEGRFWMEATVELECSGDYHPGVSSGPVESCYPESDERNIELIGNITNITIGFCTFDPKSHREIKMEKVSHLEKYPLMLDRIEAAIDEDRGSILEKYDEAVNDEEHEHLL